METTPHLVTLKGLKLNLTFSRETYCFVAGVCWNGKRIGTAENDGNGGCTFVHVDESKLPSEVRSYDFERIVDDLVHEAAKAKDRQRIVRKVRKDGSDKVLFLVPGEPSGAYRTCRHAGTAEAIAATESRMAAKYAGAVFLNNLSDEALLAALQITL
jgi:hypothetical protein